VAVVQGAVVPVWDLGLLLHGARVRVLRWCAIVRGDSAAIAFDHLDGYLRIPAPIGATVAHRECAYRVLDVIDLIRLAGAQHGVEHGR
jgi:hypothetical protein